MCAVILLSFWSMLVIVLSFCCHGVIILGTLADWHAVGIVLRMLVHLGHCVVILLWLLVIVVHWMIVMLLALC